jgi:hypothetical protein|tara:strand:- start:381 stop:569 length:189 start_codon:yes stop_codon:yes gene_type:complete
MEGDGDITSGIDPVTEPDGGERPAEEDKKICLGCVTSVTYSNISALNLVRDTTLLRRDQRRF